MPASLNAILPVIGLIAVGYFAVRSGLFASDQATILNRYVFTIAAPALLFRNTALTEIPDVIPWGLWISYYASMLGCLGLGMGVSFVLSPTRRLAERVIIGFGSGFSNTVMLGIPVILTAFGDAAGTPLFLILAFHGLIIFSTTTVLLEFATNRATGLRDTLPAVLRSLSGQQVVIALAAGVVWSLLGFGLAEPVDQFLDVLGQSAIPVALVAVGGTLATVEVRRSLGVAGYVSVMKLIVHPLIAFSLATFVFGLSGLWVAVITVLAAMPTGVFTSVFANRYDAATGAASSTITITTLCAAVTVPIWLSLFAEYLR